MPWDLAGRYTAPPPQRSNNSFEYAREGATGRMHASRGDTNCRKGPPAHVALREVVDATVSITFHRCCGGQVVSRRAPSDAVVPRTAIRRALRDARCATLRHVRTWRP